MESHYEFDEVRLLSPVAVGKPGKRTFFLVIGEKEDWVRLWLEKEQLQALSMGIEKLLKTIATELHEEPNTTIIVDDQGEKPTVMPKGEFDIDLMSLGYDQEKAILDFTAHPIGPQSDLDITVECLSSLEQLQWLGEKASAVCAAGRPICDKCGYPIDPEGHICPDID